MPTPIRTIELFLKAKENTVENPPRFQVLVDGFDYCIVSVDVNGCLQHTGAQFRSMREALQYAQSLNLRYGYDSNTNQ